MYRKRATRSKANVWVILSKWQQCTQSLIIYYSVMFLSNVFQFVVYTLKHQHNQCPVQFKVISMGSESPYTLHSISQKFPQHCLWNSSNVHLIMMALSCPFREDHQVPPLPTSPPGNQWCGVLGFVPTGCGSSTLQIFWDASYLWWLLCLPVYLLSHFPSVSYGLDPRSLWKWMLTTDTLQSGFPIPLFTFCSRLNESIRMMACVVWLSPPEAIQQKAWLTGSTSIVKMHCLHGWWLHVVLSRLQAIIQHAKHLKCCQKSPSWLNVCWVSGFVFWENTMRHHFHTVRVTDLAMMYNLLLDRLVIWCIIAARQASYMMYNLQLDSLAIWCITCSLTT